MKILCFKLWVTSCNTWNRQHSFNNQYLIFKTFLKKDNETADKILAKKSYGYMWDDGWTVSISVSQVSSEEKRRLEKVNAGFLGYDWMVDSIIKHGKIIDASMEVKETRE